MEILIFLIFFKKAIDNPDKMVYNTIVVREKTQRNENLDGKENVEV